MNQADIHTAAAAIRKRLINLLLQSFTAVIIVLLILVMGAIFLIFYRVSNFYPPFRPALSGVLESYYLGRGSWDGVETLVPQNPPGFLSMEQNEWRDSVLLDLNDRVLIDHGNIASPLVGQPYQPVPGDSPVPLSQSGTHIGTLVVTHLPSSFDVLNTLVFPLGTMIVFLGILTIVIGLLLSQRLINPLAEVIAASKAVTSGNLTARVKVEGSDDLQVLSESFNRMAGSLEKNDKDQRDLIADIAHELRTPLAILQGKLEGIMDGIYPPDKAHIQPILQQTRQLEGLISDLDMLAQADSNQLKFHYTAVSLDALVRQTMVDFEAAAAGKNITLRRKSERNLPRVLGDPQRVSQVIDNLVGNAIRYIPEGGEVVIQIQKVNDGVQLTVSDNGPGIPEADLPRIFDRFWRGEKSRSRAWGGAGLGLAIARQFVEIQGGHIRAGNRPEGGLMVSFVLPVFERRD